MTASPQTRLAVAAALVALTTGLAVDLSLRAPELGVRLAAGEDAVRVAELLPGSPNAGRLAPGDVLRSAGVPPSEVLPLSPDLLAEEPDQLESWSRFNTFMDRHTELARRAEAGTLHVTRAGDRGPLLLASRPRTLADLPLLFWFQVAVGAAGFLMSAGVLAFRTRDEAARHFALAGLGFLLFSSAAAVYSTREFLLDGRLFLVLSAVNQSGALLFTGALVALLARYPRHLGRLPLPALAYSLAALGSLSFIGQWVPDLGWIFATVLGLFSLSFALSFVQGWRTRGQPAERAALKWFLLSIYLGTGLFAGFILLPGALGLEPPASQGLMFAVFLFMFAGIVLGITRYRLFELDRWWFRAWSWFLGGLAVILFDFALAAVLGLSQAAVLGVALALVGWVYFPLRQGVWSWWQRKANNDRQDRFGQWMLTLFSTTREDALRAQWHAVLRGEFAPLELLEEEGPPTGVRVSQDGLTLTVPSPWPGQHVTLRHPGRGGRLFRREDVEAAGVLSAMARRAREAQHEREQGALAERGRILRDLHDDLGAKLLSLVYLTAGGEGEPLARAAMRDMRDVLDALEATPCSLAEAVAEWRSELQGRADTAGFQLHWEEEPLPDAFRVSARQRTNLGRVLREAVTNALKHARAGALTVRLAARAHVLELSVEDDGAAGPSDPEQWRAGVGTRVIQQRAADLDGTARWTRGTRGCRVVVSVPLETDPQSPPSGTSPRRAASSVASARVDTSSLR